MNDPKRLPPLPPIELGYVRNDLDRMSARRGDAAFIDALFDDPRARLYLFAGEQPVLRRGAEVADPLFTRAEAARFGEAIETVFLGLGRGAPRFAALLPPMGPQDPNAYRLAEVQTDDPGLLIADMRSIAAAGMIEPAEMGPLAQGKAVLAWHASHRHCSKCGALSKATQAGWRRDCPSCDAQHFPRTDPVVIMLAIEGDACLLGRQKRFPPGMYSALAGFLESGETIADACRREIQEEAGIAVGKVVYLCDQPWPFPNSLMIGLLCEATSRRIEIDLEELEDARWFTREECWLMLARQHPDRLSCPPPVAIAHHLIRAFVDRGAAALTP